MSKNERTWLIMYDIRNGKRLYYAEKVCSDYAVRVQNSVYEMKGEESHITEFIRLMKFYLHKEEDSLLIIELCEEDLSKREKYGVENPNEKFYNQYFHIL